VKVLGIDPGIANTGFGVVQRIGARSALLDAGVVTTEPSMPLERRLAVLHADIEELVEQHQVEAVAVEELYFGQNASSAMAVGQARGVVLSIAGRRRIEVGSYTPQQIKQAVCGSGRAPKDQVVAMIRTMFAVDTTALPDHAADALGAAVCHLNHIPMRAVLGGAA